MRIRPRRGLVLVKWLETRVSDVLHMIDGREGSDVLSILPGSQGLRDRDLGRTRANVGCVVALHPRDGEALGLTPGDHVLYNQEGAHVSMGLADSARFAELAGDDGYYFFVHADQIPSALPDGAPAPGSVR